MKNDVKSMIESPEPVFPLVSTAAPLPVALPCSTSIPPPPYNSNEKGPMSTASTALSAPITSGGNLNDPSASISTPLMPPCCTEAEEVQTNQTNSTAVELVEWNTGDQDEKADACNVQGEGKKSTGSKLHKKRDKDELGSALLPRGNFSSDDWV